jgi:hypothetical protein
MHLDQAAHRAAVAHNLPPHAFFWEDEATGPVVSRYKIVTRNEMTATHKTHTHSNDGPSRAGIRAESGVSLPQNQNKEGASSSGGPGEMYCGQDNYFQEESLLLQPTPDHKDSHFLSL